MQTSLSFIGKVIRLEILPHFLQIFAILVSKNTGWTILRCISADVVMLVCTKEMYAGNEYSISKITCTPRQT
jgi:hypothetical protein